MKKTISFVIAAAAVAMALVSCTKETPAGKDSENGVNPDGTRALTVSFAKNATKTTLDADGITPVWAEGDEISLNGVNVSIPADAAGASSCTIYTTITGPITAVYPAKAHRTSEPHFRVRDTQDGSFGCANICIAAIESYESELKFKNVTAVFAVPVPDGTTALTLTVTSLGKIDPQTGQRGTEKAAISTTENGSDAYEIRVNNKYYDTPSSNDFVYVAVKVDEETGVLLADLNFDLQYTDSESKTYYAQGGVSPNYIKSKGQDPLGYKAAAGTIYTPALHEYVNVELTVDNVTKIYKWATMNVGATTSNPNGDYFAWGASEVAYENLSDNTFTFKSVKPSSYSYTGSYSGWDAGEGFYYCNTPYYDGKTGRNKFSTGKYCIFGDKEILDLCDDAANANWGGSWRMPKMEEFKALPNATWPYTLTFPDAGCGSDLKLVEASTCGYYWSSTLYTGSNTEWEYDSAPCAWNLDTRGKLTWYDRSYGCSVRALSE